MKRFYIFIAGLLAVTGCTGSNAGYSYSETCGAEIQELCPDAGTMQECMFNNTEWLSDSCSSELYFFGGNEFGWHDDDIRARWEHMTPAERHAFVRDNPEHFDEFAAKARRNPSASFRTPPRPPMRSVDRH